MSTGTIESSLYRELNRQWHATSKILFGTDVGELDHYKNWLMELNDPRFVRNSSLSGVETIFSGGLSGSAPSFPNDAKFASMGEIFDCAAPGGKFEPLDINEIKDVDSILEALRERVYYCGNIILGNSKFVEKSSNVSDSFFIYDSVKISDCKNIAYSQYLRLCENVFGTNEGGESKFCIRCSILFRNSRSFELWKSTNCSDCYYSFGLDGCVDAFFSFNITGKNHTIGNLELPREKYLKIKEKLLGELADRLVKDKRLPSVVEITSGASSAANPAANMRVLGDIVLGNAVHYAAQDVTCNVTREVTYNIPYRLDENTSHLRVIEDSFAKASALIFGKPLGGGIDSYGSWLEKNIVIPHQTLSVLSKSPLHISNWPGLSQLPRNRLVTYEEALKLGSAARLSELDAEHINLDNASQLLDKISYYSPEHTAGTNLNLVDCQWGSSASNCYKSVICAYSKNCGYCSWPRSSQYCFGCGIVFDSEFSMKCYDSVKLVRCFEVDGGRDSSDTYFSHNVEGLRQALFCFNVKNKHYAVGNAEMGREKFVEIKKMLQGWMLEELNKNKNLGLDVYHIIPGR